MTEERGSLTSIAWQELFPWTQLAAALRLAVNFRALVFAAVALVGVAAGWRVCGAVFTRLFWTPAEERVESVLSDRRLPLDRVQHLGDTIDFLSAWPWEQQPPVLADRGPMPSAAPTGWWHQNPVVWAHRRLSAPFVGLFNPLISWQEFVFLLLCALWELVVWAFFGGAITRLAAMKLARDEQPSWNQLADYARAKWAAYFTAPLFPLFGVLLATVPLAAFGLLLRSDTGLFVAGLLWFLVLAGGLFMAILLIGMFFGWPLMWATISAEGTDSFDALSRSYAYTYQRPLHYFFYVLVAAVLGILGWLVVWLFAAAVIGLGCWAVSWSSGDRVALETLAGYPWGGLLDGGLNPAFDADVQTETGRNGLHLIRFWIDLVVTLAMAFCFSYFWTAATAIYFLLRRHVDATETDEVYVPEEREGYGLPPLGHDAAGVPVVTDTPGNGAASPGPPI